MSNSSICFKGVKNLILKGIIWQFVPITFAGLLLPFLEAQNIPDPIILLFVAFPAIACFVNGYIICLKAANRYAQYKGYKNYFYLYSILNIFGLSILFLLKNKNVSDDLKSDREPLLNFSISSIFISWFAIPLLFSPIFASIALYIAGIDGFEEYYTENASFSAISYVVQTIFIVWFFVRQFKIAKVKRKRIIGSLKKINWKLPIGLAILNYILVIGMNAPILYFLSFIFPQYVENQINKEYATTPSGWIFAAIGILIFAPIIEEFFFRGIIFQKLALTKGVVKALLISAISFAAIHFRYDVISLFVIGLLCGILYLKTKQLAVPILFHFFYNSIVVIRRLYYQFFSGVDIDVQTSISEFQQQFIDNWQWNVWFIALSVPYLGYFIYKNFPDNYNLEKLPYYVN